MTAEEFKALKAKVKTEMARRCLAGLDQGETPAEFGSLRQFGTEAYDFETVPEKGGRILAEQGEKVINVLYEVEDLDGIPFVEQGTPLTDISSLDGYLAALAAQTIEGDSSSCRGACSGLCHGSCIGGCNGCSGNCDSGCQGCTATCGSGCAGSSRY